MRRWPLALVGILMILSACTSGHAAEATATPAESAAQAKEDDRLPIHKQDQWQFFVSPYLWIPGANLTTTTLRGSQGTNVAWWDVVPALFSNVIGGMGRAEAWKGRWGVFLDGYFIYLGLSGSQVGWNRDKSFGPVDFTLNPQVRLDGLTLRLNIPGQLSGNVNLTPSGSAKSISRVGDLDIGGRFLVGTWPLVAGKPLPVCSLELLGGLRFNSINQYVRIGISNIRVGTVNVDIHRFSLSADHQTIKNGSYVVDYNLQFFEPFLGARLGFWLNQKFLVSIKGDVGGFGLVVYNNVDCNLEALLGYRVNKTIYAYAGYKARGTWFDLGESLSKITFAGWFHGPVLGTTFVF